MAIKKTIKNERHQIIHPVTDVEAVEGLNEALAQKQDVLNSGVNIKTINGESILGAGNIIIDGGGHTIAVDAEMSLTSENPVQNKVITAAINEKYTKPAEGIPTTDILDSDLNMTQAQINQIIVSGNITVNLAASPSPIFVGVERTISLNATVSTAANSIVIKKGSTVIATGSGTTLSGSDTITPASAGNTSYTAEFAIGGISKTASRSVAAVYPIRIGTGTAYVEGTALTTPKTSPAGTYEVTVANDGEHIYFNVPSTMTINGATMGGFAFPLEAAVNKTIDGVSYKSYASSNTYDAGTLTIVIS